MPRSPKEEPSIVSSAQGRLREKGLATGLLESCTRAEHARLRAREQVLHVRQAANVVEPRIRKKCVVTKESPRDDALHGQLEAVRHAKLRECPGNVVLSFGIDRHRRRVLERRETFVAMAFEQRSQ